VIADFERRFVSRALAESGGNVSLAAKRVGKERRSFGRLLKKHGIARSDYAEAP
jgi:transcriptional regulator with GAF, ATPase, and Fis domain